MAYIGKAPASGIRNRFIYTATAGQTTFSGSDDHNRTLSYVDEHFVDVYLNGVKLDKSDYTATSGTSVVLDEGAAVDDILEVIAFDVFSVFSGEFSQDVTVGGTLDANGNVDVAGDLTVDTNTLYVDSTNNRVGIGTTSVDRALHIEDNASVGVQIETTASSSDAFINFQTENNQGYIGIDESLNLVKINNANGLGSVNHITLDDDGHVGIGSTTASDARLVLREDAGTTPTLRISGHGDNAAGTVFGRIDFENRDTSGDGAANMGRIDAVSTSGTGTGGQLRFYTHDSNEGGEGSEPIEGMRLTASGYELNSRYTIKNGVLDATYTSGERGITAYGGASNDFTYIFGRNVADSSDCVQVQVDGNNKISLQADGNGRFDGGADIGSADYAEMFEWDDDNTSNEDRVGYSVVLTNGNKIRKATSSDAAADIIGIISGRPGVIGDNNYFGWQGKWQTDDFMRRATRDITVYSWTDSDGLPEEYRHDKIPDGVTVPDDATSVVRKEAIISDDYDDTLSYSPREERQEWDAVGMMGKVRMRAGQPTGDRWIKMRDIATDDDGNVTVEEWLVR